MKKTLSTFIALATLAPVCAIAEISLYGKANVSFESVDDGDSSTTELVSNSSRIGFKGSEKIDGSSFEAIYQLEYETYIDDGDNGGRTFGQRNIFAGIKGGFGQVIGGHFDTPLKSIQGKVDVFNDLRGDIRAVITTNELRKSNSVMYSTPSNLGGFAAHAAFINSEVDDVDDGKSIAASFAIGGFYIGAAFEQDVAALDAEAMRAVATYTIGGLQLGALYEQDELEADPESYDGWLASVLWGFHDNWAVKGQYGESDIVYAQGGDTMSAGVDYKATKNFVIYGFYTANSSDDVGAVQGIDRDYIGLGIDLKF